MPSSVWRGNITFGLVTIPVKFYRAARPERLKLREVYRVPAETPARPNGSLPTAQGISPGILSRPAPVQEPHRPEPELEELLVEEPATVAPIRRVAAEDTGKVLPSAAVTKGYEFEKGRFVTLDPTELRALAAKTSTEMELMEFVDLASVDPIYFETSYYVRPERAGEKPYALLYASLKQTGLVGVARIAMHQREHIVIVRSGKSGLIAHTMYFSSEVRSDQEYRADPALVKPKELELANTMVRALAAEFTPEKYRDAYREQVEKMIAAKIAGQPVAFAAVPPATKPPADILEALRKSLAGVKKPVASETQSRSTRGYAPGRKRR
jgi:DNA end-binding protein Ku